MASIFDCDFKIITSLLTVLTMGPPDKAFNVAEPRNDSDPLVCEVLMSNDAELE